jgi:cytochrome P450
MMTYVAPAQDSSPHIVVPAGSEYPAGPRLAERILSGQLFRGNSATFMVSNARRFGDLVHFRAAGRDVFQCNHPDLLHEMLVRDASKHHRGIVMQRARFVLGDGMLTSEEPLHMRQRRLSQPAFHRDRIAGYGEIIGNFAIAMTRQWENGSVRDIHSDMLLLALRIVGKCLFDAAVEGEVKRIAAAVDAFMGFFPLAFLPFSDKILRLPLPLIRRIRSGEAELTAMIDGMIQRRRAEPGDRGDLLSMFIDAVDTEENTGQMSDRQVRDECLTLLLAGHETTANALSFALWLLASHSDVQEAVHAEAAGGLVHRQADSDGGRAAVAEDYPALPLTHAVFAEAMRLYPPVWVTARTAAQSYKFRGFHIRAGSLLIAPQIAIHHDERFYPDPERFDPSRFLNGARNERPRLAYFPFGAGSRQCIGEGLAWMEGVLTLATIIRDWRLSPPAGAATQLAVLPRITLRPKYGVLLHLQRR